VKAVTPDVRPGGVGWRTMKTEFLPDWVNLTN
jgi:hypothetical protein